MSGKSDSIYRAVLRPRTVESLEHWEVQERRHFWFRSFYWHPIAIVESRDEAQSFINRMEREGVIYPQITISPEAA